MAIFGGFAQLLKRKNPVIIDLQDFFVVGDSMCGELGIRTPGPVTVNSFQDCRNRPLCQLSGDKSTNPSRIAKLDVNFF